MAIKGKLHWRRVEVGGIEGKAEEGEGKRERVARCRGRGGGWCAADGGRVERNEEGERRESR